MRYNFPPHKCAETIDLKAMLSKIAEEALEVVKSAEEMDKQGGLLDLDMEVGDLLHACETWLRRRESQGLCIDSVMVRVIAKNRARGYYEVQRRWGN